MRGFESFMIYTTETGGLMTVWWAPRETYEEAKRTGCLNVTPAADAATWVKLKMVAFASLDELRDFVLEPVRATADDPPA